MERALQEARGALRRGEVPIGCALYDRNGTLIAVGSNRTNELGNPTAHAEIIALQSLPPSPYSRTTTTTSNSDLDAVHDATSHGEKTLSKDETVEKREQTTSMMVTNRLTLYVTCEPCIMCAGAIVRSGAISRVVFGCANPRFGGCGTVRTIDIHAPPSKKGTMVLPHVRGGVRTDECVRLLEAFYETANPNAPQPKRKVKRKTAHEVA